MVSRERIVAGGDQGSARFGAAGGRSARVPARPRRALLFLAPFLLSLAVYLAAYAVMRPALHGDEPHYLVAAESLVFDRDVDLRNDYARHERGLPGPGARHAYTYTSDALIPFHGLGLSVVLMPAAAIGGLAPARLTMILLAALLADQLFRLLAQLGIARPRYRLLAWVAVAFCLPLLAFSNQIYPEAPGALLILVGLRVVLAAQPGPAALLVGALAAAALPWLHVRYLVLASFLVVCLLYAVCRSRRGPQARVAEAGLVSRAWGGTRTCAGTLARSGRGAAAVVLVPYVVSLAALAVTFQLLYGSPLPGTPYRPIEPATLGSGGWTFWYDPVLTDILHPALGWIPYAPVHWVALAGIGCLLLRIGWPAAVVGAAAVAHILLFGTIGLHAGFSFPARFLVIVIPLVAIPLAVVLEAVREARIVFWPLFAGSLVFAAAAVLDHGKLYPVAFDRQYPAHVAGVRSIQTAFPDTHPAFMADAVEVVPADASRQVGSLEEGRAVASAARGDPPGFVLGGTVGVPAGLYQARFFLAATAPGDERVAQILVSTRPDRLLAQQTVSAGDIGEYPNLTPVVLRFGTPGRMPIEVGVYFEGEGELTAGPVQVYPEPGTVAPAETLPDWPLAFLWVAGTLFVGFLFVQLVRLRERRPDAPHG